MGGSNVLSAGDMSFLQTIGNLSYGTWEGKSGGNGYVGAFTTDDGKLHLTKMLTHSNERSAVVKDGGFEAHVSKYSGQLSDAVLGAADTAKTNLAAGANALLGKLRAIAKDAGLGDNFIDNLLAASRKDDKVVGKDTNVLLLSRKFLAQSATKILNAVKGGGSSAFWAGIKNSRVKKVADTTYESVMTDLYEERCNELDGTKSVHWRTPDEIKPTYDHPVLDVTIGSADKKPLAKLNELQQKIDQIKAKAAEDQKPIPEDEISQIKISDELYNDILLEVHEKDEAVTAAFNKLSAVVKRLKSADIALQNACGQRKDELTEEISRLQNELPGLSKELKDCQEALKKTLSELKKSSLFCDRHDASVKDKLTNLTIFKQPDWCVALGEVLEYSEQLILTNKVKNGGLPDPSGLNGRLSLDKLPTILESKPHEVFVNVPQGVSKTKDDKQLFTNFRFHEKIFAKVLSREFKLLQAQGGLDWPMTALGKKRLLMMVVPRALMIAHAALRASTYFVYQMEMVEDKNETVINEKMRAANDLTEDMMLSDAILDRFVDIASGAVKSQFKMSRENIKRDEIPTRTMCERLFWNTGEFCLYDETNGVGCKFDAVPEVNEKTTDLELQLNTRELELADDKQLVKSDYEGGSYAAISNNFFKRENTAVQNIHYDMKAFLECGVDEDGTVNDKVKNFGQFVMVKNTDFSSLEAIG